MLSSPHSVTTTPSFCHFSSLSHSDSLCSQAHLFLTDPVQLTHSLSLPSPQISQIAISSSGALQLHSLGFNGPACGAFCKLAKGPAIPSPEDPFSNYHHNLHFSYMRV